MRCQVFWAGLFFVRRGLDPDERHKLLLSLLPADVGADKVKAVAKDFESTYQELASWFVDQVVEFGDRFLQSPVGKSWAPIYAKQKFVRSFTCRARYHAQDRLTILSCRKNKKGYVPPDLRGENAGINWNRLSLISVYSKILWVVDTQPAPSGKTGWIETSDPAESVLWAEVLGQSFLAAVGDYVCASAVGPGTVGAESISADLTRYSNTLLEDGGYKWPPFCAIVYDFENTEVPEQPSEAWDGAEYRALVTPMASFKSLTAEVDHPFLEPPSFRTDQEVAEILADFEKAGIEQETVYDEHLLETVITAQEISRKQTTEPDPFPGLPDRPIMPLQHESSVLLPRPDHYQPPEYRNALSDIYARANLWGKQQLHLHVLNDERIRLDRLMYDIQNRIELIDVETESVQSAWMEIEARLEKLQESFIGHNYTFEALHAARKQLLESKGREKKKLPPRKIAEVTPRAGSRAPGGSSSFPQVVNPYKRMAESINVVINNRPSPYKPTRASEGSPGGVPRQQSPGLVVTSPSPLLTAPTPCMGTPTAVSPPQEASQSTSFVQNWKSGNTTPEHFGID